MRCVLNAAVNSGWFHAVKFKVDQAHLVCEPTKQPVAMLVSSINSTEHYHRILSVGR